MYALGAILFGVIALFWLTHGLRVAYGALRLPWLRDFALARDEHCPRISMLFAARDEEEKLPLALATLMEIDYPNLEVIAVDDRSKDATGRILDEFAAAHPRLRVVHVAELPARWLGKPHALQKGYETATGEWLLFTDADVRFKPDSLRRAIALAQAKKLDHLTLFGDVDMHGFWETTVLTFFGLAMHMASDPYRVSKSNSRAYLGVGAFQMLRRNAYESIGTHRRLAMEVVDDMKLGKLVKQSGFRTCVGVAGESVSIQWHAGAGNIIRGVTKNFFAAFGYRLWFAMAAMVGTLLFNVLPFVGVIAGHGWIRIFSGIAVGIALFLHAGVDVALHASPFYALTHPLGAVLFCYMIVRSVTVTLWNGGVTWRGTFYRLEELKRGVV